MSTSWKLPVAFFFMMGAAALASGIKSDEEVIFFRAGTSIDPASSTWSLPVKAWVFEPETDSFARRMLLKAMAKYLGLPSGSDGDKTFKDRAAMFLADSEGSKELEVNLGPKTFALPKTNSSGLTSLVVQSPPVVPPTGSDPMFMRYSAALPQGDARRFEGLIQLAPPAGPGVICDIDDTIKVTVVLDRKEMLKNTFLRPFEAVPGMAPALAKWAAKGAVVHYVSGSPVQLYNHLVRFMDEAGFPMGGVHLRSFWNKNSREVMDSSMEHKFASIAEILATNPQRNFILVGDSGEKDPEIYAEVARKNPDRVKHIWIRKAPLANESPERYAEAFKDLPKDLWTVFAEPHFPATP